MGNWEIENTFFFFFFKQASSSTVFDKGVVAPLVSGRSAAHARTGAQSQQPKAQLQLLNPKQGTPLCWLAHAKALWAGSGFPVTKSPPSAHATAVASCSLFWAFGC